MYLRRASLGNFNARATHECPSRSCSLELAAPSTSASSPTARWHAARVP